MLFLNRNISPQICKICIYQKFYEYILKICKYFWNNILCFVFKVKETFVRVGRCLSLARCTTMYTIKIIDLYTQ